MNMLLPLCFLVFLLCGDVLACPRGTLPFPMAAPAVGPLADGTGVLYGGGGFQSSPLANPNPAPGVFMDYRMDYDGIYPGQNFMRAQGGCIHSCGWGKKK